MDEGFWKALGRLGKKQEGENGLRKTILEALILPSGGDAFEIGGSSISHLDPLSWRNDGTVGWGTVACLKGDGREFWLKNGNGAARLFGGDGGDDNASRASRRTSGTRRSFGFRLRNYLTEGEDADDGGSQSNPIADLFPECKWLLLYSGSSESFLLCILKPNHLSME